MSDMISRQTAISAICNACGKIDCDKMDKCEKLQLPPANSSEIPNNSDTISRQAAIDALEKVAELFPWRVPGKSDTYDSYNEAWNDAIGRAEMEIESLPSAQPDKEALDDAYAHGYTYAESKYRAMMSDGDCISRQAAIDALGEKPLSWTEGEYEFGLQNQWQSDVDAIKALPSAQPEAIRPKFVAEDRYIKNHYRIFPHCPKCNYELETGDCYCRECGCHIDWSEDDE